MLLLCYSLFAETDYSVDGYSGVELSLPSKKNNCIPSVKARVALPFSLFPETSAEFWKKIGISSQLSWGSRLIVTGGNINISGSYSLLNSPEITLPTTPFASLGFTEAGINGSLNSYSSPSANYGLTASLLLNKRNKVPVLFQVGLKENSPAAASISLPFQIKNLNFSLISLFGFYQLESTLAEIDDSWFLKEIPYQKEFGVGFAQEIRLSIKKNRLQLIGGAFTSPFGDVDFWGKVIGSSSIGNFSFKGGLYCGEKNMISGNGRRLDNNFQWYINPQLIIPIKSVKFGRLKMGAMFASEKKVSSGKSPLSYTEGKTKAGIEFYVPNFTVRATAGFEGFSLNRKEDSVFLDLEELYKAKFELSVRKIPYVSTINTDFDINYIPSRKKTETGVKLTINPSNIQKKGWKQVIPAVSLASDFVFLDGEYKSCTTETKASWLIRNGYFSIRGSLGLKVKNE